jgi:peroxiredoxin/predicted DsbA family dithiol-disulfide isomerase
MPEMLQPNTPAPDFALPDGHGQQRKLSDYRGRNVVLAFYPADWSSVCSGQLALYQATIDQIRSYDAEVLAVSVDNRWSHKAWAEHQKLTFPLLSDFWPHGAVAQQYGVMRERDGITERALFVIDKGGTIRSTWVGEHPGIAPGLDIVFNALKQLGGDEQPTPDELSQRTAVAEHDWRLGPADAPATIVEYGDFECPYCGSAHDVLEEVRAEMGPKLRFVYRHFPLPSHLHAFAAAEAAEAAGAQGKFWEMHDLLYGNQQQLGDADLRRYAEQLGLDVEQFARDMEQHRYRDVVKQHLYSGIEHGVNGTPTLFINGQRYGGPRTHDALIAALQQG